MEKEFIPYEQVLALKELGFDEPCIAFYNGRFLDYKIQGGDICSPYLSTENRGECPNAPLYQQAFRFFREKYKLDSMVQPTYSTKYQFRVFNIEIKCKVQIYGNYMGKDFKSYEEAELECLKKLIEIVKEK